MIQSVASSQSGRKILFFEGANVICSDPFVKNKDFSSTEKLIQECDIIIIGAPHKVYEKIKIKGKILVDIWNIVK